MYSNKYKSHAVPAKCKKQWVGVDSPLEVASRSPQRLTKYYKSMAEFMNRAAKERNK